MRESKNKDKKIIDKMPGAENVQLERKCSLLLLKFINALRIYYLAIKILFKQKWK